MLVGLESVDDFLELPDHFRAHDVDRRVVDRDTPIGNRRARRICAGFVSALAVVMAFSCLFVRLGHRLIVPKAFSRFGSFVPCRQLVNYCRACLADDLVLGIRASRTTDCADNHPLVDQWKCRLETQ
jgi:hypothetical protein